MNEAIKTVLFTFNNNFSEVLTYIAPSTSQIFNTAGGGGRGGGEKPKPYGGQNVWNIHSKSRLLFTTLALVGSPLHALYKVPSILKKGSLQRGLGANITVNDYSSQHLTA